MAVQIPFPIPSHGKADNSKMRVNLDFLVNKFNEFNTGAATWDTVGIGIANNETGTLTFYNSSNVHYLTIQAGATAADITYTLPAAGPTDTYNFLMAKADGTMKWSSIHTPDTYTGNLVLYLDGVGLLSEVPVGLGNKVMVNSTPPSFFSLAGTTNQITVTPSAGTFTFSTPQDLDTSANVLFGSVKTGAGSISATALRLNANNTGIYMPSSSEMDFVIAGTSYAALDTSGNWFATGEVRGATVRTTGTLKVSTSTGIVTIQSTGSTSYTLTLPPDAGTNNYVLTTDGTGVLTWQSATGAAGAATKALDNLASVAINTALLPGTTNTIALGSASKTWSNVFATAATFSGPVGIDNGSVGSGTAGIFFTADSDTGIYHEANNSISFLTAGAKAVRINGSGQILVTDGSAAVPTFSFFTDGGSGLYLPVSDVLGFAAGTGKVATMAQPTTSDDTDRVNLTLFDGGGSCYTKTKHYTTTSLTTAKTIHVLDEFACLIIVSGNDGTNYFTDLLLTGYGSSAVHVVSSGTVQGTPAARTYTIASSANVQLAMASGTYSVNTFSLQVKAR